MTEKRDTEKYKKNPKSDRWRINPKRHEVPQRREDRKRRRDRERETD